MTTKERRLVAAVNHLPKRKCKSLHVCKVCGGRITLDQEYFDGGIRNRTHIECADRIHIECVEE